MKLRLDGARFRYLNEMLYTTTGSQSLERFQKEPQLFEEYHRGFEAQVSKWPENPLHMIRDKLVRRIQNAPNKLQVCDLGCGRAELARFITADKKLKQKCQIESFDLVAANELITVADISNLPIASHSQDIVIFCLSLMGTDYAEFLREAKRILKTAEGGGGTLFVAEVVSRIPDTAQFVGMLTSMGFQLKQIEDTNKMFIFLEMTVKKQDSQEKQQNKKKKNIAETVIELKPCRYKKR